MGTALREAVTFHVWRGLILKTVQADWRELNPDIHGKYDAIIRLGNSFTPLHDGWDRRQANRRLREHRNPISHRRHRQPMTSLESATGNEELSTDTATSTKDMTGTAKPNEASAGSTAGSAPEPSANDSDPEATKPIERGVTPRTVVRDSLGVGEQLRYLPHRGNGGHLTTGTGAADDGAATPTILDD